MISYCATKSSKMKITDLFSTFLISTLKLNVMVCDTAYSLYIGPMAIRNTYLSSICYIEDINFLILQISVL